MLNPYCVSFTVILVHCGVWPLQAERSSESLRSRTVVVLRRARCELDLIFSPKYLAAYSYSLTVFNLWPFSSSTLCPMSRSTSRLTPRRRRCSRTRTRPTSRFTLCPRASRMQKLSWGIHLLLYFTFLLLSTLKISYLNTYAFIPLHRHYSATIKRPFAVRYDPFTCSMEVLDQPGKIQNALSQMREDLKTLHSALEKFSSS